jgi:hypothetical protein
MPRKTNPDMLESLALALAEGSSVVDLAKKNDIKIRTAYAWSSRPGVRARAAKLRSRAVDRAVGVLSKTAVYAAATLGSLLKEEHPPMIRLNAATRVLSSLIDVQAHADLSIRIAELERLEQERQIKQDRGRKVNRRGNAR